MKYHVDAYGLPKFDQFRLRLKFSRHALDRIAEKGIIQVPAFLDSKDCQIFEIEDTDVRKFALRIPYDNQDDLCIAVDETGFVRTVWLNAKTDKHTTLRKNEYSRP